MMQKLRYLAVIKMFFQVADDACFVAIAQTSSKLVMGAASIAHNTAPHYPTTITPCPNLTQHPTALDLSFSPAGLRLRKLRLSSAEYM